MKKMVSIVGFVFFVSILNGCGADNQSEKITTAILRVLFDNTDVLYKSEINRMRVAFNKDKRVLIYHFWKTEQFVENGTLFFHVYPESTADLPSNRKEFGFLNKNLKKEIFVTHDSINYYLALKMPDYKISKITTGQFINGKRNWHVNENFQDKLSNNDETKSMTLSLKNQLSGIIDKDLLSDSDTEQLNKFESLLELSYGELQSLENNSTIIYTSKSNKATVLFSKENSETCGIESEKNKFNEGMEDKFEYENSIGCMHFYKKE